MHPLARTLGIFMAPSHNRSLGLLEFLIKFQANNTAQNYYSCPTEEKNKSERSPQNFWMPDPINLIFVDPSKNTPFGEPFAAHRHTILPPRGSVNRTVISGFKIQFKTIRQ